MAEESNNLPTSEIHENVTEDVHIVTEESNNPPTSETHKNVTDDANTVTEEGGGAPKETEVDDVSMELDASEQTAKRAREEKEEDPQHNEGNGDGPSKKPRLDTEQTGEDDPVKEDVGAGEEGGAEEDDGLQKGGEGADSGEENDGVDGGEAEKEEEKKVGPVKLGPKIFNTSVEMFDYFYKYLHQWPLNVNVNKYEYMVLLDLLIKGHHESDKKVGPGVEAFQVQVHPMWKSRCYCLVRKDGTLDDFSYRKCVDSLLPLPENMQVSGKANLASNDRRNNKQSKQGHQGGFGGGRGGGGRGGGRGRGFRARGRSGRGRGPSRG